MTISEIYNTVNFLKSPAGAIINDSSAALRELLMKKEVIDTIKSVHPYKFSHLKNGDPYTKVRLKNTTNKYPYKVLTAHTDEELYLKLIEWYGLDGKGDKMTLNELFNEWMQYRKETGTCANTWVRDRQYYDRYFSDTDFFKQKLKDIKRPDLKIFCCSVISGETTRHSGRNKHAEGEHLTSREWNNIKHVLTGMFSYALDKEYTQNDPTSNMKFPKSLFRDPTPKTKETEVFNSEEKAALIDWCSNQFRKTLDTSYLLPVLTLYTGTRVGETVALKWSDWTDERHLEICKAEQTDKLTNEVSVVPHTKTHRTRTLPLPVQAVKILKAIRRASIGSEWIFSRDGKRLTERQANYILEKYAKAAGIMVKSSHKLRKTCGSDLYKAGFTAKQVAGYLGNSEEVCWNNYLFDTDMEDEVFAKLDGVA